jgi:hypothetical protein
MMNHTARASSALAVLFGLIAIGNCLGQDKVADAQTAAKVRERVDTIIKETIKRGEFTVQGVKGITRVPPLTKDVDEIKSYGDQAVAPLEEHLYSASAFEYETAMRLIGALGGARIIEPLKKVILHDESARRREYALLAIVQGPWDQASKVMALAAETDPDENVRKTAKELLSGYAPK